MYVGVVFLGVVDPSKSSSAVDRKLLLLSFRQASVQTVNSKKVVGLVRGNTISISKNDQ